MTRQASCTNTVERDLSRVVELLAGVMLDGPDPRGDHRRREAEWRREDYGFLRSVGGACPVEAAARVGIRGSTVRKYEASRRAA